MGLVHRCMVGLFAEMDGVAMVSGAKETSGKIMSQKPNLLFIMTDQQRFDALGANGNRGMRTPVLDALSQGGANLQDYYTQCPVCVPSRVTMFTGRYPHSHGILENYNLLEAGREIHLFRVLKQGGYRIGLVGKNHLVDPLEQGNFDFFSGAGSEEETPGEAALMEEYYRWRREVLNVPPGRSEIWRAGYVHNAPVESTRTWQTAEAACEFLEGEADRKEPFALCVSFEDPHVPHLALEEIYKQHPLEEIELPEFAGEEELAQRASRWLMKYGAFNAAAATDEQKRHYIAVYRSMIAWVDTQIGRILEALDRTGRREDTLIVFTSDHGDFNFDYGLAKKDLVLVDKLLHVPCIFNWPGHIKPSRPSGSFMEQVDMVPTILELLGEAVPIGVQGKSFAPVLRGQATIHKDAAFAEICPPYLFNKYKSFEEFADEHGGRGNTPFNIPGDYCKSIRERNFRYIWYGNGEEELYDHRSDPLERWNKAADPAYAAEKQRLKIRLLEWNALTQDPLDPNLRRELQEIYHNWSPLSIQPGKTEKPRWRETIHMKLAKTV